MKIEKKLLENSIVELIVESDTKSVAKYRKNALDYLEKNAEVEWFRKWSKIPENILVRKYWEEYINNMVIDFAIDWIYKKALNKENIIPVAQAEIKEVISQVPLKFKLHIEIFPEISIDDKYKKIKLKKQKIEVKKEEVENAIKEIEAKFTKYEESTDKAYKAKMWDKVTINTKWFENDKELENTAMQEYPIILWTNVLVPGFEEKIVWAKNWDKLKFPVDFPKDYHNKDFADKKTVFKVEVKKIEKTIKPEFTPEFIEQLRWKKLDFEWFKKLIKTELIDVKKSNIRMEEENNLIKELLKITKISVWPKLLERKIEEVYSEIKENITKDGLKISDYLESLKMDEATYKEKHIKKTALNRINWELILHKLMELEKIEVSEKDIEEEIKTVMSKFQSEDVLKRLKDLYVPGTKYYAELKQRMWYRKLINSFFEYKKLYYNVIQFFYFL